MLSACFLREGNCNLRYIVQALGLAQIHFKKAYLDSDIDLVVFFRLKARYFQWDAYCWDFLALMVCMHITSMHFNFEWRFTHLVTNFDQLKLEEDFLMLHFFSFNLLYIHDFACSDLLSWGVVFNIHYSNF